VKKTEDEATKRLRKARALGSTLAASMKPRIGDLVRFRGSKRGEHCGLLVEIGPPGPISHVVRRLRDVRGRGALWAAGSVWCAEAHELVVTHRHVRVSR
jgi:hypothetical protein